MSKVYLINLPIQNYVQRYLVEDFVYNPPLGLIYLGTWLELHGYEVKILDLCYEKMNLDQLLDIFKKEEILFVGITAYTENINMAYSLAKLIKSVNQDLKIVLGGAHPTLMPLEVMSSEYVDFVVRKEGEAILLELAEAISSNEVSIKFEEIPGILFKKKSKVINNKIRQSIRDLDLLPIPKRELVDFERYNLVVNVSTSRGCPARCIYCSATTLSGASYRTRDVENVFLEAVMIKKFLGEKLEKIYIVDDTFTAIPDRVRRFTELLKQCDLVIPWHCESRVDVMTEELIDSMADSNCVALQFGIESGSQEVLDKIQKGIDLEYAKKMIKHAYSRGLVICLSFILGHYCDTHETMQQTCDLIEELFDKYKAELAVSFNTPFPGTWQYTHLSELGMRMVSDKYQKLTLTTPVVETDNFTVEDQRKYYFKVRHCLGYKTALGRMKEVLENKHGKTR
ncbi:B12-binding domain-containing radical SAM protein [Clostridium thermarum]|uniref:B12-binding domain-containing radical SAM protein n=1 Tax=Clostridium thermarum TaxID=1716543 RepID=UPI0013D8244D|nr:radical SAM protein [Clostridium thermarum]